MPITPTDLYEHLRYVHLFRELGDDDIAHIAEMFSALEYEADEVIFHQGDDAEWFALIYSGEVEIAARLSPSAEEQTVLAHLKTDDYFGEQAFIDNTVRNATAIAVKPTILVVIDGENFRQMLADYPDVVKAIKLADQTRDLIRKRRFSKWLRPGEVVFLIALTHWGWLARRCLLLVGLLFPTLVGVFFLFILQLYWLPVLGAVVAVFALWFTLLYIDWRDDSYIVTSQRVISDERLALLYTARAEAPLYAVRAVQVTQEPLEKALGYGDIVIQTFTGAVTFSDVPDPYSIVNLINEHTERAQRAKRQADEQALERDIRISIGWEEPPAPPPKPEPPPPQRSAGAQLRALIEHFRPRFWTVEDRTITLRKHPFILLQHVGIGLAGLLALGLLLLARLFPIFGFLQALEVVSLVVWIGLLFFVGIFVFGWTWYQFEDWRNDIYQITPNLIVDSEKKPLLGNVEQRTASIDSILNVSYDRPGLLANLFNFGTVTIQTGGETGELTFSWVVNPLAVQQELFQRMEDRRRQKETAETDRRRSEIVEWLKAYAAVTQPQKPPNVP